MVVWCLTGTAFQFRHLHTGAMSLNPTRWDSGFHLQWVPRVERAVPSALGLSRGRVPEGADPVGDNGNHLGSGNHLVTGSTF